MTGCILDASAVIAYLAREPGFREVEQLLDDAATKYGLEGRSDVAKSPAAMRDVLTLAQAQGHTSPTVTGIVEAILALCQAAAPAVPEPEP